MQILARTENVRECGVVHGAAFWVEIWARHTSISLYVKGEDA